MRYALLTTAALIGLAAAPAVAQNVNAPDAASTPSNPQSPAVGTGVGTGASTGTGMTGMRPMRGQQNYSTGAAAAPRPVRPAPVARTTRASRAPADDGMDAPSTGQYRGGAGSPLSQSASNTTAANTRSEIAPRLPDPGASASTPEGYIAAAQRALASGRTGAAQEALERAETRLLTRSTDPSMAASPADMPMVQQISEARRALASRDVAGARTALGMAMSEGGQDAANRTPSRNAAPRY